MYERTIALKNQNPSLKILLAVGGDSNLNVRVSFIR